MIKIIKIANDYIFVDKIVSIEIEFNVFYINTETKCFEYYTEEYFDEVINKLKSFVKII